MDRFHRVRKITQHNSLNFIFNSPGTLKEESLEGNPAYEEFKRLNDREQLIKRCRDYGLTSNPIIAKFILHDGSLIEIHDTNFQLEQVRKVLCEYGVQGLSYIRMERQKEVLLKFFCWYTDTIRMFMDADILAVQLWTMQNVSKEQWEKINYLIRLVDLKIFAWDLELGDNRRIPREIIHPKDCSSLKDAYLNNRITVL